MHSLVLTALLVNVGVKFELMAEFETRKFLQCSNETYTLAPKSVRVSVTWLNFWNIDTSFNCTPKFLNYVHNENIWCMNMNNLQSRNTKIKDWKIDTWKPKGKNLCLINKYSFYIVHLYMYITCSSLWSIFICFTKCISIC